MVRLLAIALVLWLWTIGQVRAQLAPYVSANNLELERVLMQDSLIAQVLKARGGSDPCGRGASKHRVQIMVSIPQLNASGQVVGLNHKTWGLDTSQYFYPASLVKLPTALVAMEQVNEVLKGSGPPKEWTDVYWVDQKGDCRAKKVGRQNISGHVKSMALVSDNDAYNFLFRMLGPAAINQRMSAIGMEKVQVVKSFDGCPMPRVSLETKFGTEKGSVLTAKHAPPFTYEPKRTAACAKVGKAYWQGGRQVNAPFDFTYHNVVALPALHNIWCQLVYPDAVPTSGLALSNTQRLDYLRWCTQTPQEGNATKYSDTKLYPPYLKKYLYYGTQPAANAGAVQDSVFITNVVGQSHGFLADVAHLHVPHSPDAKLRAGIVVSAVVYVNDNEVLNDGVYQYQSVGMPFMRNLGRVLWEALVRNK